MDFISKKINDIQQKIYSAPVEKLVESNPYFLFKRNNINEDYKRTIQPVIFKFSRDQKIYELRCVSWDFARSRPSNYFPILSSSKVVVSLEHYNILWYLRIFDASLL